MERRDQVFHFRINSDERKHLETLARRLLRTPSDALRIAMRSLERELDRQQHEMERSPELLTTD